MLSQFTRLTIEADGRFATAEELGFIKSYLNTAYQRISAYEAIRDEEEVLMDQSEARLEAIDPQVFKKKDQDVRDICRRDRKSTLRYAAAAMLIDDLSRLKDGLLIWQRTTVRAVKVEHASQQTWAVMPEVLREHLGHEVADFMTPALRLNQSLLN